MVFIFGGAHQGKLEYALSRYGLSAGDVCDCTSGDIDLSRPVIYGAHMLVRRLLDEGAEPMSCVDEISRARIVVGDDICAGIVPVDAMDRLWRDSVGSLYKELVRRASRVERIFYSAAQTLKDNCVDDKPDVERLMESARCAVGTAYAPYSKFRVGAAILSEDGRIYIGCNVENSSFGAGCCAERTALFTAVADGARRFSAIAVASDGAGVCYPCGICRQALSEFGDMDVICGDDSGGYVIKRLSELLPDAFKL